MATQNDNDDDKDQGTGTESGLRPVTAPPLQGGDDDYEIVETDAAGNVINTVAPPAYSADEGRLSEEEGGTGPLIPAQGDGGDDQPRERDTRRSRNARQRERRDRNVQENERLRAEMEELRGRLDSFQGTATTRLTELGEAQIQQQIGRLDTNIANADAAYRAAGSKIAQAMSSADNDALVAALEERDAALVNKTQLNNEKTRVSKMLEDARAGGGAAPQQGDQRQPRQPAEQRQTAPAPLPTRAQQFVRAFNDQNHDWFNPNPAPDDIDSNTALAVDRAVAAAGFDPSTPDYWAEVDNRLRERLPHLFDGAPANQSQQNGGRQAQQPAPRQQQAQQQPQRRGPPTGGVGDRGPAPSNRTQLKISPARKEAMIQAGAVSSDGTVLDKPKFQRLLKGYADFDRTNPNGR